MSALPVALEAELQKPRPLIFGAVEIVLPTATIRLLDGSGEVTFGGQTFRGKDATFGVLAAIDALDDGLSGEAPALSITILPPADSAIGPMAGAAVQGAQVRVWVGAINSSTGLPVSDPYLLALLEIDVPTVSAQPGADGGREVEYQCVSAMERLFDEDEGMRLGDALHQNVWPGETGMAAITGITQTIYWGLAPPAGTVVSSGGGYGGGAADRYALNLQ